jgi:hypothetical protein
MTARSKGYPLERASPHWLRALRIYLGSIVVGNLIWETLQLPLYTIWDTGTAGEQVFAVVHCLLGDLSIAVSALTLALFISGDESWPAGRFWQVAGFALIFGVAYTAFSEWRNVTVHPAWAYSDWMPVLLVLGLKIGLSPLLPVGHRFRCGFQYPPETDAR